jgi:hypothetical protein
MSESVPEVKVEEVVPEAPKVEVPALPVPEDLKALIEKTVKDVVKAAVKELLDELKKTPLSSLDKDGDGVISAAEVKEAVTAQAQKLGCAPTCSIA